MNYYRKYCSNCGCLSSREVCCCGKVLYPIEEVNCETDPMDSDYSDMPVHVVIHD